MDLPFASTVDELRGNGRGWALLAIAAGWLFIVGGRYLIPAVLPQVMTSFDVKNTGGGIAVTTIWATYGLMQAPSGLLTDRLGERLLLSASLLLSAASLIALSISPLFIVFLMGCAAFGFATGLYGPPRGTALSRIFPDADSSAIGVTLAAGSLGSALLPFLAGTLVGNFGWQYVVAGLFPPLAIAGGFAWWTVPERASTSEPASLPLRDLAGDVLYAVRLDGVKIAFLGITLILFVFQALSAFYVTYLVQIKGFEQSVAAGMLSLLFVSGAISQAGSGLLTDRFGERWVLVGISGFGTGIVALLPFADSLIAIILLSLALGIRHAIIPISNTYMIAILPDSVRGTAWGFLRAAFFLVGATGSTVVGILADGGLFNESFFLLAGLTGLAAGFYLFLPARSAPG